MMFRERTLNPRSRQNIALKYAAGSSMMASAWTRKGSDARRHQLPGEFVMEAAESGPKPFTTGLFALCGSRFLLSLADATLGHYTLDQGHVTGIIELDRVPPERVELNN